VSIIAVISSPRKGGFGERLFMRAVEGARESGKEVEIFRLNDLNIRQCQNCESCRGNDGHCVMKDDISPILERIRQSDGLIVSGQIRFARIDGALKTFADRFYSFMTDRSTVLDGGKRLITILTAGADETNVEKESAEFERMMNQYFLFEPVGRITYLSYLMPADSDFIDESPLMEAYEAGKKMRS
jgi:multimeric flavodoxin WrbA